MSPLDWATRPLKKYTDFSGRAPRAEYWWFYLLMIVAYFVAMIIDSTIGTKVFGPYGIVTLLVIAALVVPYVAVAVRRLHDTNRTGWWILAPTIFYCVGLVIAGPSLLNPATLGDPASLGGLGIASIFFLLGLILGIVVFVFFLLGGTKGPNKYGDDPYAGGAARAM